MKYLLSKGLLHGDCLTVTGKTVAENLAGVPDLDFEGSEHYSSIRTTVEKNGTPANSVWQSCQKGSVAKISGKEGEKFVGPARVFDGEQKLIAGIQSGMSKSR